MAMAAACGSNEMDPTAAASFWCNNDDDISQNQ